MTQETWMTRRDDVGNGPFDSINWLYETVLHEHDHLEYDSALVFGNEDSPSRVEFYTLESPCIQDTPARVWIAEVE